MSLALAEIKNHKDTLSNGLTVVTIEMPHIHTLEVAMMVRAGLRMENESNNGISHFLEHMMFRGNRKYPDSISLSREFEKIGKDLSGSTLSEYTFYGFTPHPSNLERGLEIFADFFTEPVFPSMELERKIILEEFLEDLNGQGVNVDINNLACQLLYKGNPLALPIIGTDKTIAGLTREMLQDYFETYYNPPNMILACAGCVGHEQFLSWADRYFLPLPARGKVISKNHFQGSLRERQEGPDFSFLYDSDSQVQLQICFRSVSYNDPDYYKVSLINSIFDDGVSSRLQRALREEKALAYSLECRATGLSDVGTFDFDVGISKEKVIQTARLIFHEIKSFLETGPGDEELDHVKKRYYYDLEFELDDPYKQICRYGFAELYSREISVEEERAIIESITREDLHEMARRIFVPGRLNVIAVGPLDPDLQEELKHLALEF